MNELRDDSENQENYQSVVEALLFASDIPLSPEKISSLLEKIAPGEAEQVIDDLNKKYEQQKNSFSIRKVGGGYQMYTLPNFGPWI